MYCFLKDKGMKEKETEGENVLLSERQRRQKEVVYLEGLLRIWGLLIMLFFLSLGEHEVSLLQVFEIVNLWVLFRCFSGSRFPTGSNISPLDSLKHSQPSDMGFSSTTHLATSCETCMDDDKSSTSGLTPPAWQGMQWNAEVTLKYETTTKGWDTEKNTDQGLSQPSTTLHILPLPVLAWELSETLLIKKTSKQNFRKSNQYITARHT